MTSPVSKNDTLLAPCIFEAAQWLATQKQPPVRVVPELRERFGLSALEACQAIKEAQMIRARAM